MELATLFSGLETTGNGEIDGKKRLTFKMWDMIWSKESLEEWGTKPSDSKWNLRYNTEETAVNMRYTCETSWFLTLASRFLNLNRFWLWYVLVPSQLIVNRFWYVLVLFSPGFPMTISESLGRQRPPVTLGRPGCLAPSRRSSSRIAACQRFPGSGASVATEPVVGHVYSTK